MLKTGEQRKDFNPPENQTAQHPCTTGRPPSALGIIWWGRRYGGWWWRPPWQTSGSLFSPWWARTRRLDGCLVVCRSPGPDRSCQQKLKLTRWPTTLSFCSSGFFYIYFFLSNEDAHHLRFLRSGLTWASLWKARSLATRSVESWAAFTASVLGMTRRERANSAIASCSREP